MQTTTYYDLNIVEGTDIVNPLTVDNPNYEKIDEEMHKNAVSGVTLATEIANATVHAINRENSECSVIRFIATSNWKAGDTATVDGVPVTALLPSGETLPDGAYVINANVLCILTGSNLTVYVDRKKIYNASEIVYNDTNVADELTLIDTNLSNIGTEFINVSKVGSGIEFYGVAIKIGNVVSISANINIYTNIDNTNSITENPIPIPYYNSRVFVVKDGEATAKSARISKLDGLIYPDFTMTAGSYYLNGSYICK